MSCVARRLGPRSSAAWTSACSPARWSLSPAARWPSPGAPPARARLRPTSPHETERPVVPLPRPAPPATWPRRPGIRACIITFSDILLLEIPGGAPMTRDSIRGSSDRSILILTSLADWPKHGYALIKDIESFAGVKLGAGTLYSALAKLERAGLIEALPAEDRRRPYQITPAGREFLYARLTESARIAEIGLRRIAAAWS